MNLQSDEFYYKKGDLVYYFDIFKGLEFVEIYPALYLSKEDKSKSNILIKDKIVVAHNKFLFESREDAEKMHSLFLEKLEEVTKWSKNGSSKS